MNCPKCKRDGLRVVASIATDLSVHRRRKCTYCEYTFATIEIQREIRTDILDQFQQSIAPPGNLK